MKHSDRKLRWIDLGNAAAETRQVSPVPPFYADSSFGMGSRPDSLL
jgi:hypothetical protein